jgi:hypothetical protein
MENHTKRIRKARRQGLGDNGKGFDRSPRVRLDTPTAAADVRREPRANARRNELVTGRKAKRQRSRGLSPGAVQSRATQQSRARR